MRRRRQSKSDKRARALLRDLLTPDELRQLIQRNRLDVPSPSDPDRVYRIPRDSGGLVWVFERGVHVMWICIQPVEPLPDDDYVLMHRAMIQGDEQGYLASGNCILVGDGADPIIWALAHLIPALD